MILSKLALIAIGPKELPGVLRSVGQWVGKARRLAADFQGQFQEAIREAELADVKKQFDEMSAATSQIASGTTVFDAAKQDVEKALMLDPVGTPTTPLNRIAPPPSSFIKIQFGQHESVRRR